LGPIPNPQSPIPNPQSPFIEIHYFYKKLNIDFMIIKLNNKKEMNNFKGIFYKAKREKKYYEGGAHFKYSDLVKELNKLINKPNINLTIDNASNSSSQRKGLKIMKYNLTRNEDNKDNLLNHKGTNSNLLTLNNYKDMILSNKRNFTKDKNILKKNSLESFNDNLTIIHLKKFHANSINKNNNKNIINTHLNNINKKFNIEQNNDLPLIGPSYFSKFPANLFETNKNVGKIKLNFSIKNKIFSPSRNNDNKNTLFSFKSSDMYKNQNNLETIDILSRRRNYYFGKMKNNIKIQPNNNLNNHY
jgi:hypothetical protein